MRFGVNLKGILVRKSAVAIGLWATISTRFESTVIVSADENILTVGWSDILELRIGSTRRP